MVEISSKLIITRLIRRPSTNRRSTQPSDPRLSEPQAPFAVSPTLPSTPRSQAAVYDSLSHLGSQILPPQSADITSPDSTSLLSVLNGASAVVNLAGVLVASPKTFYEVQEKGAENVVRAAKEAGVGRCVMVSAIGADVNGPTPS